MKQLFPSNQMVMTRSVQTLVTDFKEVNNVIRPTIQMEEISQMLVKHFANMGEECWADKKLNKQAIENMDGRVVSSFSLHDKKFYVITDGLHLYGDPEHGDTYPLTTVMLKEDY